MLSAVKTISRSTIEWYWTQGYNSAQMAAMLGVSPSYMSLIIRAYYGANWKKVKTRTVKEQWDHEQQEICRAY